jgi:hypothetical protein
MAEETVDYGPLKNLIGTWEGEKGMDISPEKVGVEENPYFETITYEEGGDLQNAKDQRLAIVPYHQVVSRKRDNQVFHDERGYLLWDAGNQTIIQSFTIPRGVATVAGCEFTSNTDADTIEFEVKAEENGEWNIAQSPYMRKNAKTTSFSHRMKFTASTLEYSQTMMLDIYGREFEHTDDSVLTKK